jgi:hypothetical protein
VILTQLFKLIGRAQRRAFVLLFNSIISFPGGHKLGIGHGSSPLLTRNTSRSWHVFVRLEELAHSYKLIYALKLFLGNKFSYTGSE